MQWKYHNIGSVIDFFQTEQNDTKETLLYVFLKKGNVVQTDMYLLLHHRQPLACSSFRGAALGLCATHYHLAFVQQTESLVPCLRTTINHRVKHIQQQPHTTAGF